MIIAILGRQPKLGLAELESLYSAEAVTPLGDTAAMVSSEVTPLRLGGTLKLAKPITELPYTDWQRISSYCADKLPEFTAHMQPGKLKLGLSAYGLRVTSQQLFRTGLELKKAGRGPGRSVRIIPSEGTVLNSAAVLHNQLTGDLGLELVFVKNGDKTWVGQTTWVQDIDDYSRRDFGRPKRDAFVGMLPPKLAQTMINLANGPETENQHFDLMPDEPHPEIGVDTLLDPFCGTGVVLQEAALMYFAPYGTDISERMIDFSRENLEWLGKTYGRLAGQNLTAQLQVADATTAKWEKPIHYVATETYLGQPLSGLPKPEKLASIIQDCNTIISKFLKNLRPQLEPDARLCIAVPAWRVNGQFKHLPLLDRLEEMGYNRLRFQHAPAAGDLMYHREDQIVARELLVLTVK